MRLKDFNKFVFTEEIPANNPAGSFTDRTELSVTTDVAYLLNPVTTLASEISEFYSTYWASYNTDHTGSYWKWIYSLYPDPVVDHIQNHYRATAISILRKQGLTVDVFKKIVNAALGYPFALVSGIVELTNVTGSTVDIHQYPFENTISGETTNFIYRVPVSRCLVQTGDIVDFYQPLVSGISYYDIKDNFSWFTAFDPSGVVPLNEIKELDYQVNKRRIVGISRRTWSGYNYDFTYFGKLMSKICPKDVILLYKEIS